MEGLALYNLGEVARDQRQWTQAITWYQESQKAHRILKDASMEAHALAGEAECRAREHSTGLGTARQLLAQARALNTEDTPYILRAKAWVLRASGDNAGARTLFQKALADAPLHAPELVRELRAAAN